MLIKNSTQMTMDSFLEFNRTYAKRKKATWILYGVATFVSLLALFLDIVTMPITGMGPSPTVITIATVLVVLDVYFILLYTVLLKKNLKKNPMLDSQIEYEFYDELLVDTTTSKTVYQRTEIRYDTVFAVDESENYIYIYIDRNRAHVISKSGFTVGNEQMLKDLLREKLDAKKIRFK